MTDSTMTEIPLTPKFIAMNGRDKWETLVLTGLIGEGEPWIEAMRDTLRSEAAMLKAAVEALEWYREQAEGCRKIGYIGDPFRQTLDADGGKRAADTLASLKQPGGE
jgi:hypothetical protein